MYGRESVLSYVINIPSSIGRELSIAEYRSRVIVLFTAMINDRILCTQRSMSRCCAILQPSIRYGNHIESQLI